MLAGVLEGVCVGVELFVCVGVGEGFGVGGRVLAGVLEGVCVGDSLGV